MVPIPTSPQPLILQVEEATSDENSAVQISENKLKELGIFHGDTVILRGNKRKKCPAVALKDPNLPDDKIRMNKTIRQNLRVRLGGKIRSQARACS